LDDPPGYCGGVVTTGPGQAWDFDVPEDGELEVSNLESAAPAPREDTPDMIQIRRQIEGGWETLGLQCDSSGNGPVRVQVEAGDHVEVRLFTQEDETVAGWYEIVWTPDMPWGSSPGTAIPYQHPLDLNNAEMPDVSIPLPCAENSTQAIWYRWKAPSTGLVNVTTCGQHTSVDTVLSIHLDTPTLDLVGCDDDSCDGGGSTLIFEALEGTEYLIRTASSSGAGNIHLSIKTAPLPGEHINCNDAQSISSLGIYSVQTGGNASAGDCDGALSEGPIAWVAVTPPADAAWRLSLCQDDGGQASSLGAMALYETCTSAQPIKCAQTQDCNGAPIIDLPGGTTSLVQVRGSGNLDGTHGPLTALLALVETPPPPCLADLNEDGQVGIDDLLALLDVYGTPGADIDGNGVSDINDLLLILNAWGGCP
ncbi:MAG: hypothetical protein VX527_07010, partial [Planctomycetota bacterium]|nr:hypothetical protein [Planctomycetota bacterium]